MKTLILGLLPFAVLSTRVVAATFSVNQTIPDNDINGLLSVGLVSGTGISSLGDVNVWLRISGGYNGDLQVTLSHGSGYSVLLNRVGRTAGDSYGYTDEGFSSTFMLNDEAANGDVHDYRYTLFGDDSVALNGDLDGVWAPDGRATDPSQVVDTDPRSAMLISFIGSEADGEWFLHAVDLGPGGESTLVSWGLEFSETAEAPGSGGSPVPEPSTWILGMFTTLTLVARLRRANRRA